MEYRRGSRLSQRDHRRDYLASGRETVSRMSDGELVILLEKSRTAFSHALIGMLPPQWTWKPAADRWNIFEITEHLATVETGVARLAAGRLFAVPADQDQKAETRGKDQKILAALRDRSRPMEAPESVRPAGRWPAPAEAFAAFEDSRNRIIELVRRPPGDLRNYCAAHPILGILDGYQWMLFLGSHLERHIQQIEEIRKSPGFPARV